MKVHELVRALQELGIEAQDLEVFRADIDFGPVAVREILEHPMYRYKGTDSSAYIDYFPEVVPDEGQIYFKGVQIR